MFQNRQRSRFNHGAPRQSSRPQGGRFRRPIGRRDYPIDKLILKSEVVETAEAYVSTHAFLDFPVSDIIKKNIVSKGYTSPTPIQDQAIPAVLEGKDVVGIANTGTGKTAAFLIPLINKVSADQNQKVLIIVPTRELAIQIRDEADSLCRGLNLRPLILIGGASMNQQRNDLRYRPQIIIGTPGRLMDLNNQRALNFANFNNIVLDEVDRMLDMGFVRDIKKIIAGLPSARQSLFFSATMTPDVAAVMQTFLHNPVTISVKTRETSANVDQDIVKIAGKNKVDVLHELLIRQGFDKVLVFGRTKWGIEKLSQELNSRGFKTAALHGNKSLNQRQMALRQFKENRVNILLATDVASRGLDINGVTHVINFDLPEKYEDYIHRIGRTGRANQKGIALSLVD